MTELVNFMPEAKVFARQVRWEMVGKICVPDICIISNLVGTTLELCWSSVGLMLMLCWSHAGIMLEVQWKRRCAAA